MIFFFQAEDGIRDAELILDLLLKDEFPRIHRVSAESREVLRQLRYRHRLVQQRTRSYNSLQTIAPRAGGSLKAKMRTPKSKKPLLGVSVGPADRQPRP